MIRITLSPDQKHELEHARRHRPYMAERCHYVLLSEQGVGVPQIAKRLDRDEQTVRAWLRAYQREGIEGLVDAPKSGRPALKGQASISSLKGYWPNRQLTLATSKPAGLSTSFAIISPSIYSPSVTVPYGATCKRVAGSTNALRQPCRHTHPARIKKSPGGRHGRIDQRTPTESPA